MDRASEAFRATHRHRPAREKMVSERCEINRHCSPLRMGGRIVLVGQSTILDCTIALLSRLGFAPRTLAGKLFGQTPISARRVDHERLSRRQVRIEIAIDQRQIHFRP